MCRSWRPSWKQFAAALKGAGAVVREGRGDHEVWTLPCGARFVCVQGHPKERVAHRIVRRFERAVANLPTPEDPP